MHVKTNTNVRYPGTEKGKEKVGSKIGQVAKKKASTSKSKASTTKTVPVATSAS
jgi:hypothetical protein